ncbi:SGNH/GDSL hydrolase family protein, partial [Acinetobacter baumannii]|nr:SGNH/GDSL hydrolase family protein [Acinetobacter baumannii]
PVNPSAKRYIIALGDSLTDGTANSGVQGAWVNECSRRLNGVGYQLLSPELSPAPLAMTNLAFIGTLGNNAVKHEGRGGWAAKDYLTLPNINNVTNAFWNTSTYQFDLNYYLSQNGFTGVNATGSNLTVIILLGWNDVYDPTSGPTQSAADLANLIDKIKSTHPDVDFICLGLNQAPDLMFKTFTGTRYVSKREVFESIKAFNDAYKAMIATKTKVDFLQISCTFCSEIGYNTTITDPNTDPAKRDPTWHRLSARSVTQLEAVDDHVHPNKVGYAMIADAVCYFILYQYCRA